MKAATRSIARAPLWGLSAIAVGSIASPLPGAGALEDRPQARHSSAFSFERASTLPLKRNQNQHKEAGAASGRKYPGNMQLDSNATPVLQSGRNRSSLIDLGDISATNVAVPAPLVAAKVNAGQPIVGANIPANLGVSAAVASTGSGLKRSSVLDNKTIFGTSAQNAYKVYFPQIDTPAQPEETVAKGAEGDLRVLRKKGDYLFFEDPSEKRTQERGVSSAVDKANISTEEDSAASKKNELTAPALQKQPLNLTGGLSKEKPLSETRPPIKIVPHDQGAK